MPFKDIVHGLHLHWLKPKKELTEVYIFITLRYLAFSMINLFIPLYLYHNLGYSLNETLWFFVLFSALFAFFTPFAAKLVSKIGVKHTILSAMPFYLIFYFLLYGLERYSYHLYYVPVFFALAQALFWMGFHTEFIKTSDHNHRGRDVGKYISLAYIALLIGPFIGGLFIDNFGFTFLFVMVGVLFFLATFFLFFTDDFRTPGEVRFRHIFTRKNIRNFITFTGHGAQSMAESVLWPLFIFVILKTYTNLGLLGSAMSAVMALVTYLVGKASDKYNRRSILYTGGIVYSLTWLVRTLFSSLGFIFGISIFAGFANTFVNTPMHTLTYDKAEKNTIETLVFRELALCLGRILILLIVIFTGSFLSGFIFSAIGGLGYLFF